MDIKIATLYSGSSGNSVLVGADGDYILIDAGRSAKALTAAVSELGVSMDRVGAVFVTHEHVDHIAALDVLSKKHSIPVHITEDSASAVIGKEAMLAHAVTHTPLFSVRVGKMTVSSFRTSHDSAMSVGYTVDFDGEDVRLGLVTDTGHVTETMMDALSGATHIVLEANHDVGMLRTSPYPFNVRERIASARGHLSNEQSACAAVRLTELGAESILLSHLSENCNTPELALSAVSRALDGQGLSPKLAVAARYSITRLI